MQNGNLHDIGKQYSREAIRAQHGAENINDVYYLQHAGGKVVALCLRKDTNPEAPTQVWVGAGPKVAAWGNRLATPDLKLPLYLKAGSARTFTFLGWHRVLPRKHTAAELQAAMDKPGIGRLSRIVFMQPAKNGHATSS